MSNDETEERRCPVCGRRVSSVTVIGPDEAVAAPCRHRVDPAAFE